MSPARIRRKQPRVRSCANGSAAARTNAPFDHICPSIDGAGDLVADASGAGRLGVPIGQSRWRLVRRQRQQRVVAVVVERDGQRGELRIIRLEARHVQVGQQRQTGAQRVVHEHAAAGRSRSSRSRTALARHILRQMGLQSAADSTAHRQSVGSKIIV